MEKLQVAKIISKKEFFEGQRVLLDFMQHFDEKSYMFVGNTNHGFIAIAKER